MKREQKFLMSGLSCVGVIFVGFLGYLMENSSQQKAVELLEDPLYKFTTVEGLECVTISKISHMSGLSCNWQKFNKEITDGST